VDPGGRSV
jgi:hypothetical protein